MNDVLKNIQARRSVRLFENEPIHRATLEVIIDAGNNAPSGMNTQGWRFVVVETPSVREKLTAAGIPKYKEWLETAPKQAQEARALIDSKVIDPVFYSAATAVFVVGHGMAKDMDCPMVCQNMMLAARSLGIGSCWIYMGQLALADDEVKNIIQIKDGETVYGPIIFGYPKDEAFPPAPPKNKPVIQWI